LARQNEAGEMVVVLVGGHDQIKLSLDIAEEIRDPGDNTLLAQRRRRLRLRRSDALQHAAIDQHLETAISVRVSDKKEVAKQSSVHPDHHLTRASRRRL